MYPLLKAMVLVFVALLPAAFVHHATSPTWEWRIIRARWAFALGVWFLFNFDRSELGWMAFCWCCILAAYLSGYMASIGLLRLWLGKLPPPRELDQHLDYRLDPLYDWSKKARQHKVRQFLLPYVVGYGLAGIAYLLLV